MIYLDNSATTKPWPEVLEAYQKATQTYFGNPSSLHRLGTEADTLFQKARQAVAKLLGAHTEEIIFTSGGTEGNNLAIKGIAFAYQTRGKHLITSTVEHPSVLEAFRYLETLGFEVTYVPVDQEGRVNPRHVEEAVREDTTLVSIVHVNNEMGTIQPIEEISRRLKKYPKLFFHTDHVQGVTHVPFSFRDIGVDLCTISGHKFHGLKGTGVLVKRKGIQLSPLFHGGGQEFGVRSGTENVPGMVALAKALRITRERQRETKEKILTGKKRLLEALQTLEGAVINTPVKDSAPHIVNVSFPTLKPEVIIQALTKKGIHVSTKSACSSKENQPSAVIEACGLGKERAESAIRISFSVDTTEAEVEELITQLRMIIPEMRKVMGVAK